MTSGLLLPALASNTHMATLENWRCSTAQVEHSGEMLVLTLRPGELCVCAKPGGVLGAYSKHLPVPDRGPAPLKIGSLFLHQVQHPALGKSERLMFNTNQNGAFESDICTTM